jgi:hypothetical protein
LTTVPLARTFGGRKVKNRRAGLAHVEKGLNLAVTSVMNLVIILPVVKLERLLQRKEVYSDN